VVAVGIVEAAGVVAGVVVPMAVKAALLREATKPSISARLIDPVGLSIELGNAVEPVAAGV